MKKEICFMIIFVISSIINVNAMEKPTVPSESDLIGMCYYEYSDNDKQYNLELYIKKDYSMIALGSEIEYYEYGYANSGGSVTISYDSFMSSNVFDCNNVSKVYVNKVHSGSNYETTTYYIDLNKNDHTTTDMSGANYPHEYQLNKDKSKVYVINQDSDLTNSEGWIQICHYDSSYLKIGKSSFETDVDYYNQNEYVKEDLMTLLSENSYSCPVSLCHESTYDVSYSYFTYQYKPKCITSTQYNSNWNCGLLSMHMGKYDSLKADDANKVELNKTIDTIKSFCSSVFKNQNYSSPTKCVKECLEINQIFKKDMNLDIDGTCGFSDKLIYWIANIIRWVKYIIPVAVIVLGILDFMKAMSADKEDEMKKAQQRFIRRLIAAALIFIAPFIIEFILNKLGFNANGCGIINL